MQICVKFSASNFQVLTRKSGGHRAFGNFVRFSDGPARTTAMLMWYFVIGYYEILLGFSSTLIPGKCQYDFIKLS